jgi:hypothetical protein
MSNTPATPTVSVFIENSELSLYCWTQYSQPDTAGLKTLKYISLSVNGVHFTMNTEQAEQIAKALTKSYCHTCNGEGLVGFDKETGESAERYCPDCQGELIESIAESNLN